MSRENITYGCGSYFLVGGTQRNGRLYMKNLYLPDGGSFFVSFYNNKVNILFAKASQLTVREQGSLAEK